MRGNPRFPLIAGRVARLLSFRVRMGFVLNPLLATLATLTTIGGQPGKAGPTGHVRCKFPRTIGLVCVTVTRTCTRVARHGWPFVFPHLFFSRACRVTPLSPTLPLSGGRALFEYHGHGGSESFAGSRRCVGGAGFDCKPRLPLPCAFAYTGAAAGQGPDPSG